MITLGQAPICGNAALLSVEGLPGADYVQVLRRLDANFTGPTDPGATIVWMGNDGQIADITVDNGTEYFYKDYSYVGSGFTDDEGLPVSVTPAATYQPLGPDVRAIMQTLIDNGLQQEIARSLIKIKFASTATKIDVLNAPPQIENTKWPVVSVQVVDDQPGTRGLGESAIGSDDADGPSESMLDNIVIGIDSWSQNPDERHRLHQALKRIMLANASIYTALGMIEPSWSIKDVNFIRGEYDAPVYCASISFTCQALSGVIADNSYPIINDTLVTAFAVSGVTVDQQGQY